MSENRKNFNGNDDYSETVQANHDTVEQAAKKRRTMGTKAICYTAVFVALSAVTNIVTFFVGGSGIALSLTYIPNFFAGALLGPLAGFVTGFMGDLIGCWIAPQGALNPIILLASGLMGFIPGIIFKLFRKSNAKHMEFVAMATSLILIFAVCSTVNTLGLYLFYFKGMGKTLGAVFALRTAKQALIWSINSVIVFLLYLPVKKALKIY